jgi:small subunit ribosomal protein S6
MRFYELAYLISPDLNQMELQKVLEDLNSLVQKVGPILKIADTKKIKLAYQIEKKSEAFFGWIEFEGEPEKVDHLKKELEKKKEILRFLLIKKKKLEIKEKKEEKPEKPKTEKKAELKEIEEKLEEILK